jgi:PAS domain S-box-containing protein
MASQSFHCDLRDFLYRSNPVPMFLFDGRSLRILGANDAAIAKYGYSCKEFRAMTIRDLRPCSYAPSLDTALLLDLESPSHSLWTHSTRAGRTFAVEVSVSPFDRRRLFLMSAVDASAWSEARLELVRSEEVHRTLVEECPFGIYRLNLTTSRFEQANSVLLRVLGYSLEELCSIDILSLYVDPSDRARFLSEMQSNGSVRDFDTRFRDKDGNIVRVSLTGYLCPDTENGQQYMRGYVLDITRQRDLEEQLSRSQRMKAVGQLAGGVAHDFNNITQSISLSCELALRDKIAPALEGKLLDIMQQTARAAEITRQLLAFSRRQVLQPRVLDINDCIRRALPMLASVGGVDVRVELNLDESVDHIFIDPDQFAMVLMHLTSNARAAMPKGGLLQVSTSTAAGNSNAISEKSGEPCAVLTVSDTGAGMDEQTLQRIFEPFFSTKDTPLTSGLGLSTVYGIIAQSKGRIECESSPGQGATFRIYLPFASVPPTIFGATSTDQATRILFAEDDRVVNKHLSQALRKAGFTVDSVCDGEKALAALEKQRPNIVVTDIVMPRMGGVEFTKRLRQQHPTMPVVLISGYSEEVGILQHVPHNQIAYLQKPFTSSQLIGILRKLLAAPSAEERVSEKRVDRHEETMFEKGGGV